MATTKPVVLTFGGGEVDSYTDVRVDLSVHGNAAKRLENISLITQGAMELPPGTKYIGDTPDSNPAWLFSWNLSVDFSFMLEVSNLLVRFIFGDGYVTLDGAAATVGDFADSSGPPDTGGGAPPDGSGTLSASLDKSNVAANSGELVTCTVIGGSGAYTYQVIRAAGSDAVTAGNPNGATSTFTNALDPAFAIGIFYWHVTDTATGQTADTDIVGASSGEFVGGLG